MDNTEYPTYLNEYQAERLADLVESKGLMTAPANLKSAILERSRQTDVQMIAGANRLGRQAELLFYGLKVGAAVVCSISLILAAPLIRQTQMEHQSERQNRQSSDLQNGRQDEARLPLHDRFHRSLMEFSERAGAFISEPIDMEVFFND